MSKFKTPIQIDSTFDSYQLTEQLGEGGAGRVYGGTLVASGAAVAVKVLTSDNKDKRRRFKNEIAFLSRNRHAHIVTVIDHGLANSGSVKGPFYVMARYAGSLRDQLKTKLVPDRAMALFSQIISGVEAAHLQSVTHRDLKPENVLIDDAGNAAVADFGVARFTEDILVTLVETAPTTRLANFQYAAPEQRVPRSDVGLTADIYSLGLMLNELFTGSVPHGTDYQTIASVASDFGFLDSIVAAMLRQDPNGRPQTIGEVKTLIQRQRLEAVSLQKLNEFDKTVIPVGEVSAPLAHEPPKLIAAEYSKEGVLRLTLDRRVNQNWVRALHTMGSYASIMGVPPTSFSFNGSEATVHVGSHNAQGVIDHFKRWLPTATANLRHMLEEDARLQEHKRRENLRRDREAEERFLQVNRSLQI